MLKFSGNIHKVTIRFLYKALKFRNVPSKFTTPITWHLSGADIANFFDCQTRPIFWTASNTYDVAFSWNEKILSQICHRVLNKPLQISPVVALMSGGNKNVTHTETCIWKLEVCLSMCNLFVTTGIKWERFPIVLWLFILFVYYLFMYLFLFSRTFIDNRIYFLTNLSCINMINNDNNNKGIYQ